MQLCCPLQNSHLRGIARRVRRAKNFGMSQTSDRAALPRADDALSPVRTLEVKPEIPPPPADLRLLDRVRHAIRVRHLAIRTEPAYVGARRAVAEARRG